MSNEKSNSVETAEAKPGCAPATGSAFWDSPALKARSKHYPERFMGRVPMRIKMLMNVRPDPWCGAIGQSGGPGTILRYDETYECWTNSHGAVAGICANGFKLGVKPDEFEVVEWYMPNDQAMRPPINKPTSAPGVVEPTEGVAGGSHQRMVSLMECVTCKKCSGEPKPQRDERGCWQIICRGCGWKTETFHNPWIAADSWNGHQAND